MLNNKQSIATITRCGVYTLVVIGCWTIWCLLMEVWPQFFAASTIRAIARVSIVFIPAVIFYYLGPREKTFFDYFSLRKNWGRGVIFGGSIAILYFSISRLIGIDASQGSFQFPTGFSVWVNFIIGSPLAEELFFRGVLLQELKAVLGVIRATAMSSFAFALLHLPQWLILENLRGLELLSLFVTIFFYGVIFALFVNLTRSLWSSLLPHWINNFILFAIG